MDTKTIDTTIPVPGRVYDYLLGGTHNYEADRHAGEYMASLLPSIKKWVRLLRSFLQEATALLASEGYDQFLDLGSGLPTADNIHAIAPNARVIYTDYDAITAAYGRELLKDVPNTRFLAVDVRDIDAVLNAPEVAQFLDNSRPVVIGLNGMTCFFTEEQLQFVLQRLYDWAAPGSRLFSTFETKNPNLTTPSLEQLLGVFAQMGSPYYFHTAEQAKKLAHPWQIKAFKPITEWLNAPDVITEEDRAGVELEFYGVILGK